MSLNVSPRVNVTEWIILWQTKCDRIYVNVTEFKPMGHNDNMTSCMKISQNVSQCSNQCDTM